MRWYPRLNQLIKGAAALQRLFFAHKGRSRTANNPIQAIVTPQH